MGEFIRVRRNGFNYPGTKLIKRDRIIDAAIHYSKNFLYNNPKKKSYVYIKTVSTGKISCNIVYKAVNDKLQKVYHVKKCHLHSHQHS